MKYVYYVITKVPRTFKTNSVLHGYKEEQRATIVMSGSNGYIESTVRLTGKILRSFLQTYNLQFVRMEEVEQLSTTTKKPSKKKDDISEVTTTTTLDVLFSEDINS